MLICTVYMSSLKPILTWIVLVKHHHATSYCTADHAQDVLCTLYMWTPAIRMPMHTRPLALRCALVSTTHKCAVTQAASISSECPQPAVADLPYHVSTTSARFSTTHKQFACLQHIYSQLRQTFLTMFIQHLLESLQALHAAGTSFLEG